MKNHLRKLMAVTCALVMLLSCMAVAGVSAAAQAYTWTFSTTENCASGYWSDTDSTADTSNNSQGSDYFTTLTSGTGYNGSDRYVRMAYASNVTSSPQLSVLSLPNNTGSAVDGRDPGKTAHLLAGVTYKVTVAYKVISAPVDAQLVMSVALGDLRGMSNDTVRIFESDAYCGTLATIAADEVSEDWVVKTAAVTVPQKQGVYVALAPNDNASRNGLELHLGYVAVEEAPAATDVTFVYNDNETSNTVTSGVPGLTALPTPVSALGWTFQGWYDNADCTGDAVTAWPAAATTLYAKWDKSTATEVSYTVAEFSRAEYTQGSQAQTVRPTNTAANSGWFGAWMYPSGNAAILTYVSAGNSAAHAGFRVLSDTSESFGGDSKDMLAPNAAYRVEFDYQTTAVASVPMQLRAVVGDVRWCASGISGFDSQSYYYKNYIANNPDLVYDVATIGTVMAEAAHADFMIQTGAADNYFSLVLPFDTNCAGVSVTIDNVKFTRVATVNVTFDGNDGADTVVEDKKAAAGSALPTPTHVRGYDFLGWYADAACTDGNEVTVWPAESTTLYAKWDKSTPIYKVTYDPMAGSLVGDAVQYGAAGTALTGTAKLDGYKFEGWTDAEGNPVTAIGEADITVYAGFKQVEYVPHTEGVQDFEGMKIDDFIWATNTDAASLTVDRTANYTKGGITALHATIRAFGHGQRQRPRIVLQEEGQNVVVKAGDKVTVSFWIKSSRDVSALTFYLATMDATTAADHITATSGNAGVCHNLQTINTLNGSTSFENTNGKEPKNQSLKAGEWTQFTAVINSIAADSATNTADDSIDNYLELGFADDAGVAGFKEVDLWVDDIIVLVNDEAAPVPVASYEKNAGMITFEDEIVDSNYGFVNGPFSATVSNDISHAGGTNSLKITQTGADSGANRAYVPITAENVVAGKQYLVSFWLYVENDHNGLQLRYWLAPNDGTPFTSGTVKDGVKIAEGVAVSGYVGNWVRTTVLTNAVLEGTANVLYLGISDAAIANKLYSGTSVFYLDDISVADPTALTQASIEGNVAVYKNQANSSYFYEEGKAAMRYVAGYKTTRMDCNNIILDGVDYNLNERGLIFGTTDMNMIKGGNEEGAGVEGTDYLKWVFKNENLSTCWSRNADGTVQYSFYVKGVNAANHATQFKFRSYVSIAVQVPNAANTATVNSKLVIYGDIVTASYDDMFAVAAPTDANPFV